MAGVSGPFMPLPSSEGVPDGMLDLISLLGLVDLLGRFGPPFGVDLTPQERGLVASLHGRRAEDDVAAFVEAVGRCDLAGARSLVATLKGDARGLRCDGAMADLDAIGRVLGAEAGERP